MRIVVDENIPLGREAFSRLGRVDLFPGRSLKRDDLLDADVLLVRSITKVDRNLLEGTSVRFVGTATIGTDHVDRGYLNQAGIAFADAAGCNANSVGEYITAALLDLEAALGVRFEGRTLGIVGVGNVGSNVARRADPLGLKVLQNDPPRAEREGPEGFVSLEHLLAESDIVTFHTPLERGGKHPTYHLCGERELAQMKPDALLLNTSRGPVVDNSALLAALEGRRLAGCALDVWENEPYPDPRLLDKVDIATPHIAGYSFDGKVAGTRMMFESLCRFLKRSPSDDIGLFEIPLENPHLEIVSTGREALREAVFGAYPIQEDDRRTRRLLDLPLENRGAEFDRLRKEYPVRREFHGYRLSGSHLTQADRSQLADLGFQPD